MTDISILKNSLIYTKWFQQFSTFYWQPEFEEIVSTGSLH